jgi:hypothetical protein
LRISAAQIAFENFVSFGVVEGAAKRADLDAHPAFNTFGCVHNARTGSRIFCNGVRRADGHATGFFTLHAHHGCGVSISIPRSNFDSRAGRVELLFMKQ